MVAIVFGIMPFPAATLEVELGAGGFRHLLNVDEVPEIAIKLLSKRSDTNDVVAVDDLLKLHKVEKPRQSL